MSANDYQLGMDNSPEPFFDGILLLTACSFTLLVGIIIGYYVEVLFKKQTFSANFTQGNRKNENIQGTWSDGVESVESSGTFQNTTLSLKEQYINRGTQLGVMSGSKALTTKPSKVPKHIAVIMDGNRRFGRQKHGNALQGHWAGGQTLVDMIQWCKEDGVQVLTVYAFSTENWSREPLEVQTLMSIFAKYAESFRTEALTHNVKVNVLTTDGEKLPESVVQAVQQLEAATAHCTSFTLNICLSYGARGEIVNACKTVSAQVLAGTLNVGDINEQTIGAALSTHDYPDPDILIRTSGEYRLSNFLLWQMAYTEMFFVDKMWPQLTKQDFRTILHTFASQRSRRFGF